LADGNISFVADMSQEEFGSNGLERPVCCGAAQFFCLSPHRFAL
jgi:hypothetical protein